jgi:hypothetical protein
MAQPPTATELIDAVSAAGNEAISAGDAVRREFGRVGFSYFEFLVLSTAWLRMGTLTY